MLHFWMLNGNKDKRNLRKVWSIATPVWPISLRIPPCSHSSPYQSKRQLLAHFCTVKSLFLLRACALLLEKWENVILHYELAEQGLRQATTRIGASRTCRMVVYGPTDYWPTGMPQFTRIYIGGRAKQIHSRPRGTTMKQALLGDFHFKVNGVGGSDNWTLKWQLQLKSDFFGAVIQ